MNILPEAIAPAVEPEIKLEEASEYVPETTLATKSVSPPLMK